mmetsp:Transcript_35961/g.89453  ORF Transcript_35961/g.89453 Transcript_35961/m.89453 type:complete len:411 (+) Transcript_35961:3-1235(+)
MAARGPVRSALASPWARHGVAPAGARMMCSAVGGALANADAEDEEGEVDGDWQSLGMAPRLLEAVGALGHATPTPIQSRAFAAIRAPEQHNVVIAGETGIGKTLAYLLPAIDALLQERAAALAADLSIAEVADGAETPAPQDPGLVLVVQPNADLSYQAAATAEKLLEGTGLTLVNLHAAHDYQDIARCNVLIGTSPRVLASAAIERTRFAVLDESDALLAGSFKTGARQKYPIEQLLLELRRELRFRKQEREGDPAGLAGGMPLQHVLVGATVPAYGTRNVKVRIDQLFPDAQWVQSPGLHRTLDKLEVTFVKIDRGLSREQALANALSADELAREAQTLVFANTVSGVERALEELERLQVSAAPFHKNIPVSERRDILERFQSGELRALVSTGLAVFFVFFGTLSFSL